MHSCKPTIETMVHFLPTSPPSCTAGDRKLSYEWMSKWCRIDSRHGELRFRCTGDGAGGVQRCGVWRTSIDDATRGEAQHEHPPTPPPCALHQMAWRLIGFHRLLL